MRLLVDERGGVYGAHGEAFAWQIGIDRAEQRVVANVSHREEGVCGRKQIRGTPQVRGAVGDTEVRTVGQPGKDAFGCYLAAA